MWDEEDEYDDFYLPDQGDIRRQMEEEARKKWRDAAYRGYDLLVSKGKDAIDYGDRDNAILAIRRILGLMINEEQYERCNFLKKFLEEDLDLTEEESKPIFDFEKTDY